MTRIPLAALAIAGLTQATALQAAVPDAEWEQFKARFTEMEARVNALEAENARLRQSGASTVPVEDLSALQADVAALKQHDEASSWTERLGVKGDFRYRYETIDVEDAKRRERNRIRARVALTADLPNDVEVGFGLATGGSDPVSSNQTLGGGGSSKDIALDKAYARWQVIDQLALVVGKYSNPLYRPHENGLMWDSDWRPEGISAQWKSGPLFANFLGNYLESDSGTGNDEFAWGVQGGTVLALGDNASLTAALGYFDFPTAGATPFYNDKFFGNTSSDNGTYLYNYEMVEASADLALSLMDMPLSVYGDYVQNQDADANDIGWQAGVVFGKANDRGRWSLGYAYQDLEADAVLGLLSDSDFAGGGTDAKGHKISGAIGINKQWSVGFTWYVDNEYGKVNLADEGGARGYDRLMLDTQFKY